MTAERVQLTGSVYLDVHPTPRGPVLRGLSSDDELAALVDVVNGALLGSFPEFLDHVHARVTMSARCEGVEFPAAGDESAGGRDAWRRATGSEPGDDVALLWSDTARTELLVPRDILVDFVARLLGWRAPSRTVANHVQRARAAARGESVPAFRVLPRADGAEAVAFLVTVGRPEGELVVPLRAGRNLVGRGVGSRPYGEWPAPHAVEQAQWLIECDGEKRTALVEDAASTNLSVLYRAADVPERALGSERAAFAELIDAPGVTIIPHPNAAAEQHRYGLAEGDVLRGIYAAFAFAWVG